MSHLWINSHTQLDQMHRLLLITFIALPCCVGCGGNDILPVYPVSGKVIFSDGTSPKFGDIEFSSETEPPINSRGRIQEDGTFEITGLDGRNGAIAGWHQVIIIQVVYNPLHGNLVHDHGRLVARKYSNYRTTNLRAQVKKTGNNRFELLVDSLSE